MTSRNASFFADTELVTRIERAESELILSGAEAVRRRNPEGGILTIPIAGGVAAWAEQDSPLNKVAGLGFAGFPGEGELDAVERAFGDRSTPVRVELASLADPEVAARLARRGYLFAGFENVLGLPLGDWLPSSLPAGVEVVESGPEEFPDWLEAVVTGFAHPDAQGVPSDEEFPREVLERVMGDLTSAVGFSRYLARRGGAIAGGASLRMGDGVAQLCGAATLPAHRRQGVQTALLLARLDLAQAAGCDVAVVTTQPGSKSQENVQRQGFQLLYTRAVLIRERSAGIDRSR
ncbi:MAG TPA: GNAT family N-acetyltransferase [Thermoanaerobaculia bacterium]|nr:GNAT family N-acetyltransferase [Thermoanaerobaculia bacterium]